MPRKARVTDNGIRCALKHDGGSVTIVSAAIFVVVLWLAALVVDIGMIYFERRTAQGAVDLAAIAAAQNISEARAAARATLDANSMKNVESLTVTPGRYQADPSLPTTERFTPNAEPFNAVQVTLRQNAPLYMAGALTGQRSMVIETESIAVTTAQAAFSIGSRLARLEGGILNALLKGLLGGSVELSIMDYEQLAKAEVGLFQFMEALATELRLTGASYNEVLAAETNVGTVLEALAKVNATAGQAGAARVLNSISVSSNAWQKPITLGKMIDLGPYGKLQTGSTSRPRFDASVNVLQLVTTAASIANGDRQISLNIGVTIPGLSNVQADLAIGERPQNSPWLSVGERGTIVRTAQTRLRVLATVGAGGSVSVRVPLYAELAYAEGRLGRVTCGRNVANEARVDVDVLPGVAAVWLGDVDPSRISDFTRSVSVQRADLASTPLASVSGAAHTAVTNTSEKTLSFSWQDIQDLRVKSTSTREPVTTMLNSLMRNLDLKVELLGLGVGLPSGLKDTVASLLTAATPALDQLLSSVFDALGVSLGEADIRATGVRCDGAALVG